MSDTKIKVIIKRPDEPIGHVTNIANTLKNFQRTVDGPIQVVPLGRHHVIVCNEEGKLRGLEPNVTLHYGLTSDVLVGTVIICGVDGSMFRDIEEGFYDSWKVLLKKYA